MARAKAKPEPKKNTEEEKKPLMVPIEKEPKEKKEEEKIPDGVLVPVNVEKEFLTRVFKSQSIEFVQSDMTDWINYEKLKDVKISATFDTNDRQLIVVVVGER